VVVHGDRYDGREPFVDFEIKTLNDGDGGTVDCTVADADTVDELVEQAAATGQRLYIRPVQAPSS
jgi:hypothetical protein